MGTFVLRASLDPALMDALLSGALVTVKHWPTAGTGSTSAVLGQVIAVTHPLNGHAQRVAP
ncbi:hypothetical protein ACGFY7_39075 [Streptomyces prunicolor]|uniref:hypothetical protein n=1 Tax=Streptomyces prunicolor TaxID=67348 RepID=UPI003722045B